MTRTGGTGDRPPAFDADTYHRTVVGPLRAHPRRIPSDLRVRYAVPDGLSDAQLAGHIATLTSFWSARGELADHSQAVYTALCDAHAELLADPGTDLHSARWWDDYHPPVVPTPAEPPGPVSEVLDAAPLDAARTAATAPPTPPPARAPAPPADADGPLGLVADRTGDEVSLSWIWPEWATEALVTWPRGRRTIDHETYLRAGCWTTTLTGDLAHDEVEFCVAVRGVTPERTAWSPAVCEKCPGPRIEVVYTVRRVGRIGRRYAVDFRTGRPPASSTIAVVFSPTDHLPWSIEGCEILDHAYLTFENTTVTVGLRPGMRAGYLRCFVVEGLVSLTDPHPTTLRIRQWPG